MSEFRHILNGTPVEEPMDWAAFQSSIVRDYQTKTISEQFPGTAQFSGQGYDILRALWIAGTCSIAEYQVDERCGGAWRTAIRANIIIADLSFTLPRCEVTASLVDDGIGARISNNRRIPISHTAEKTKNGVPMAAVPEINVGVFRCQNGAAFVGGPRRALDWKEAMTHAVRYITDDNVQVVSDWYDSLPDDERYMITIGLQLRASTAGDRGLYMEYSFEDLFDPLAKAYDLWLFVTRAPDGSPIVNIEPDAATASTQVAIDHQGVDALEQELDSDRLYASVAVGSESGLPNLDSVWCLPFLILIGHSEERFHFEGVCNNDAELDLVIQWAIDTNLIQRTLQGNTDADDDIFLIQYTESTLEATQGNDFQTTFQYNPALLNFRVLGRYNLPSDISVETANPDTLVGTVTQVLTLPLSVGTISAPPNNTFILYIAPTGQLNFSVVNDDPGTNFQLNPGRYTAPIQGFYSFIFTYRFFLQFQQVQSFELQPNIQWTKYDAANNVLATYLLPSLFPNININTGTILTSGGAGPYNASSVLNTVMFPGDYIEVRTAWRLRSGLQTAVQQIINPQLVAEGVSNGYRLVATGVAPGGGVVDANSELSRIIKYTWSRPIDGLSWAALAEDPRLMVSVSPIAGSGRSGVPSRITRTMADGSGSLEILTDRTQPF